MSNKEVKDFKRGTTTITNNLDLLSVQQEGQGALATVDTVLVLGHTDTGTATLIGAILARSSDLAVLVHLVELEDGQLHDFVFVL